MRENEFARPMVNSGRLSVPCTYDGSPLNGADALPGAPVRTRPGAPCPDAPLGGGFLLDHLRGGGFVLLGIGAEVPAALDIDGLPVTGLNVARVEASGPLIRRYLGEATGGVYLIRPDQHVAARWPAHDETATARALAQATAKG